MAESAIMACYSIRYLFYSINKYSFLFGHYLKYMNKIFKYYIAGKCYEIFQNFYFHNLKH